MPFLCAVKRERKPQNQKWSIYICVQRLPSNAPIDRWPTFPIGCDHFKGRTRLGPMVVPAGTAEIYWTECRYSLGSVPENSTAKLVSLFAVWLGLLIRNQPRKQALDSNSYTTTLFAPTMPPFSHFRFFFFFFFFWYKFWTWLKVPQLAFPGWFLEFGIQWAQISHGFIPNFA